MGPAPFTGVNADFMAMDVVSTSPGVTTPFAAFRDPVQQRLVVFGFL